MKFGLNTNRRNKVMGGGIQRVVCQRRDSNVGHTAKRSFVSNTIQTESTTCSQRTYYLSQLV